MVRRIVSGSDILNEGMPGKIGGTIMGRGWNWDALPPRIRARLTVETVADPVVVPTRSVHQLRQWFADNEASATPNAVVTAIATFIDNIPRSNQWVDRLEQFTLAQAHEFCDWAGARTGRTPAQIQAAKDAFTEFFGE